jgi:ABC-type antimicrobial peptide transport system permease subunit
MFNFRLVKGDVNKVLLNPNDVVISESMAARLFGNNWPNKAGIIGTPVTYKKNALLIVAGIAKDAPVNSSIQFNMLTSMKSDETNTRRYTFNSNNYHTYVQLKAGTNAQAFGSKITKYLAKYNNGMETTLAAQPLFDIYLYSHFDFGEWIKTSSITYTRIFLAVGIIVLLIAIFNFINLATARAIHRAREVGVRKAIGAFRRQLVMQFLGESLFMTGIAVVIALFLLQAFLPLMNSIAAKHITIPVSNPYFALSIIAFALLVSLLAGIYPAFYLSKFRPVKVLKGMIDASGGQFFRRSLVVGQFMFSIILIIGAIVIYRQLTYIQDKDLGFNQQQLLTVSLKGDLPKKAQLLKADLLKQKGIVGVSCSSTNLVDVINSSYGFEWQGQVKDDAFLMTQAAVDPDFLQTTGMQLAEGRNFNANILTDSSSAYLVSETAAKRMGYTTQTAIGKTITFWGTKGSIIGVVKDFNFRPLTMTVEPFLFRYRPNEGPDYLFVKTTAGGVRDAIASIETTYKKYDKKTTADYSFIDKMLENQYHGQQRTASVILYFSILAIFVSCLGLFGLATFAAEQRKKEIGIRKVVGASVTNIVTLFSRDFIKLVAIAIVIATPAAWYLMNRWLQDFAYRVNIEWWMLLLAAGLCIGIAMLTVGVRAIKAALANPVKSLRTE